MFEGVRTVFEAAVGEMHVARKEITVRSDVSMLLLPMRLGCAFVVVCKRKKMRGVECRRQPRSVARQRARVPRMTG